MKSRSYCLTCNNPTDDDIALAMSLYEDYLECKYLIIAFEKGRNETPHMQIYVYYSNPVSPKRFYPFHYEKQKASSNVAAYCYCMKELNFIEYGERPRQGHRTDLEVIKNDILLGKSDHAIAHDNFSQWCQYRKAFTEFRHLNAYYNTKLIIYKPSVQAYQKIHHNYNTQYSKIYTSNYYYHLYDLINEYYTHKYEYIFIPSDNIVNDLNNLCYEYIE